MKRTILYVDDSSTMRLLVRNILTTEGYDVIEAADGAEGLEKADAVDGISMVITDLNMPKLGGVAFIQHLRQRPAYRDVPVLVISTMPDAASKAEAKAAGASGWMTKPIGADTLRMLTHEILGRPGHPACPGGSQPLTAANAASKSGSWAISGTSSV